MATITSLGVGSGLDLTGLLDQLRDAERGKLEPLKTQQAQQDARISAYGRLQTGVDKLQSAAAALNDSALFQQLSVVVQGDGLTASASETASPGRYDVTVTRIATAGTLATDAAPTRDEPLFTEATTLTLDLGATYKADGSFDDTAAPLNSVTIDIAAGSSLEAVRDAINANAEAGVTAAIVNDGNGYRLALSSEETGAEASLVGLRLENVADPLAAVPLGEDAATLRPGNDAELDINGITITSATNTVAEAIQGVSLTLSPEAAGSTLGVTVSRDDGSVKEALDKWVSAYNELQSTIGRMTKPATEGASSGELIGDRTVRTLESRMVRDLTSAVPGGEFALLADLGVSLNKEGRLEVDEETLDAALADSPGGVAAFFAGDSEEAGMAGTFNASLERMLDDNGLISNAIEGAESRVDSLGERYARMEASVERTIERYRVQFGQLDSMIASMNQTSSYLMQQFDSLNAQLGRD
ncbi:flagellar filament capping protein FliD [Halomonas sp. LR5S13]|uniref:flagellar filament capping protein FliD n=1 Tax=Halomonas rhizosphaerae TaxID=3043296 RepID=UPI0024A8F487|nr:flagellar filament capping protein FliD [Halomonas rhizosphaerae]MDI5922780.1 flagellar filament capping protein FliD [Halomonas rhizosphaerae]